MEIDAQLLTVLHNHIRRGLVPPDIQQRWQYTVVQACGRLATNPDFLVLLEWWLQTVLLQPCQTPIEEGKRQAVLGVIDAIRQAQNATGDTVYVRATPQ